MTAKRSLNLRVSFTERLKQACISHKSLLCVGLDPYPNRIAKVANNILDFNSAIVDATVEHVCAYKPNMAFYEVLGAPGLEALKATVQYIKEVAPDIIIIGDGKRGDIGPAMEAYPCFLFEDLQLDAIVINPYLGFDSIKPFVDYYDGSKGVFLLCHSSNPSSIDFQDLMAYRDEGNLRVPKDLAHRVSRPLFEHIALKANKWNEESPNKNIGLVVGATYPEQLKTVRKLCPTMPILIPGVGEQGGDLEAAVRYGTDSEGLAIINSSRQILYASDKVDFAEAAGRKAKELKEEINRALCGR